MRLRSDYKLLTESAKSPTKRVIVTPPTPSTQKGVLLGGSIAVSLALWKEARN